MSKFVKVAMVILLALACCVAFIGCDGITGPQTSPSPSTAPEPITEKVYVGSISYTGGMGVTYHSVLIKIDEDEFTLQQIFSAPMAGTTVTSYSGIVTFGDAVEGIKDVVFSFKFTEEQEEDMVFTAKYHVEEDRFLACLPQINETTAASRALDFYPIEIEVKADDPIGVFIGLGTKTVDEETDIFVAILTAWEDDRFQFEYRYIPAEGAEQTGSYSGTYELEEETTYDIVTLTFKFGGVGEDLEIEAKITADFTRIYEIKPYYDAENTFSENMILNNVLYPEEEE